MTALAAVLALSSTSLLAQTVETAPAAPVVAAPSAAPPVDVAPVAPTQSTSAPALNIPHIAVNLDDAPKSAVAAEPKAKPVLSERAAPAPAAKPSIAVKAAATPRATAPAPEAPAVAPVVAQVAPPAPQPVEQPAANPAPVPTPLPAQQVQTGNDETLPIAGAIGFGALLLAGGAVAFSRRRRRDEEFDTVSEAISEPVAERDDLLLTQKAPAMTAAVRAPEPLQAGGPATPLPAGFDMSRYGRHVQAAYRGPTADNPSLSLKNRLRRANFFDQRERMGMTPAVAQPQPRSDTVTTKAEPATASRGTTNHLTSRTVNWKQPNLRPAYQS